MIWNKEKKINVIEIRDVSRNKMIYKINFYFWEFQLKI